jgi:hypothetical protein
MSLDSSCLIAHSVFSNIYLSDVSNPMHILTKVATHDYRYIIALYAQTDFRKIATQEYIGSDIS